MIPLSEYRMMKRVVWDTEWLKKHGPKRGGGRPDKNELHPLWKESGGPKVVNYHDEVAAGRIEPVDYYIPEECNTGKTTDTCSNKYKKLSEIEDSCRYSDQYDTVSRGLIAGLRQGNGHSSFN
jgi:hypothetical protein